MWTVQIFLNFNTGYTNFLEIFQVSEYEFLVEQPCLCMYVYGSNDSDQSSSEKKMFIHYFLRSTPLPSTVLLVAVLLYWSDALLYCKCLLRRLHELIHNF